MTTRSRVIPASVSEPVSPRLSRFVELIHHQLVLDASNEADPLSTVVA